EPRSGGPNWLVFNFSETIRAADGLLSANEFGLTNANFDSATITNNVLVLRLKNVVNQSRVTVNLLGLVDAAGNALAGTSSVIIRSLYGDVNRSGSVSTADQQAVKNGLLQTVSAANYLLDLNLSGTISVTDQQIVKNALFTSVP
ncbi:MAG TPA: dockerin type I domain-containing protein, partial [Roseimicrobium sp.]|nr:dockerin type I domain-containing protein [Roseimicrobium sp.]